MPVKDEFHCPDVAVHGELHWHLAERSALDVPSVPISAAISCNQVVRDLRLGRPRALPLHSAPGLKRVDGLGDGLLMVSL